MKKIIFSLFLVILCSHLGAQVQEPPYIEVQARAEKEVVPDQIYVMIALFEIQDGRKSIKLAEQESKLKNIVKGLGLPLSNLSLYNAQANYGNINNWGKKDVIDRKYYSLKLSNAETIGKLYEELNKIYINEAYIYKSEYSQKDSLLQDLRIEAMRKAKNQANVMTRAIGSKVGKPLIIREQQEYYPVAYENAMMTKGLYETDDAVSSNMSESMEYKPLKISLSVYVKFALD
jgi:uncharacterized protein YggE